jgi:YaaC-like Protein
VLSVGGSDLFAREGLEFAWRWLCGQRATPPGAAKTNADRAATFNMALQQSEELFKAAASAGVASKPLLVFYGLTQAGRAIAAVAPKVPDRQQVAPVEPWKLKGHGIGIPGMEQAITSSGGRLAPLPVADKGTGAFTQIAEILGSGSLISSKPDGTPAVRVTVEELWNTLPETFQFPLTEIAPSHPFLTVENGTPTALPHVNGATLGNLGRVPQVVKDAGTPQAARDFLGRYLTVGDYRLATELTPPIPLAQAWSDDPVFPWINHLTLWWQNPAAGVSQNMASPGSHLPWVGTAYLKDRYLFPALGDNPKPLHPLLAWWAILYVLSMVARYEPRAWQQMIAIDASTEASPIEHFLGAAVEKLPRIVFDAIDELTI